MFAQKVAYWCASGQCNYLIVSSLMGVGVSSSPKVLCFLNGGCCEFYLCSTLWWCVLSMGPWAVLGSLRVHVSLADLVQQDVHVHCHIV